MAEVLNIFFIFIYTSVLVIFATRFALDDIGEHLSPKYAPAIIAPPRTFTFTPPVLPITIKAMPTVPIVPKEVPIKNEIKLEIKKADKMNNFGFKNLIPKY